MHCRKNQVTLTAQERARFVAAVIALKAAGKYDQYVLEHQNNMPAAHRGPAFLPWHREFLRRFELDLRAIDSGVTLPYWDWTVDNSPTSPIWNDDFMGPNGRPSDGQVMSGPFAHSGGNWTLAVDGPALRRRFGVSPWAPALPTGMDVTNALATVPYDLSPYNDGSALAGFRNTLEGWRNGPALHNRVHVWVGGSMGPASSPNDPVFFLHHCFIDKLWADWQALHPGEGYAPVTGGPAGHNLNDAMQPWAGAGVIVTPASVLDHHALDYAYDTEAICRPTVKFRDDIVTLKAADDFPTLKFRDDVPTLKFRDDNLTLKASDDQPTLKVLDDQPTVKFADDPVTVKFADDPGTAKFADDPGTTKFADDPGTLKAVDDAKIPTLDPIGPPGPGVPPDAGRSGATPGPGSERAAPFVLSTPHHTMAWARTFPGSLETTVAHLEAQLQQYAAAIRELEQRLAASGSGGTGAEIPAAMIAQGAAGSAEAQLLQTLRREFEAMCAEHHQLIQHLGGQAEWGR